MAQAVSQVDATQGDAIFQQDINELVIPVSSRRSRAPRELCLRKHPPLATSVCNKTCQNAFIKILLSLLPRG